MNIASSRTHSVVRAVVALLIALAATGALLVAADAAPFLSLRDGPSPHHGGLAKTNPWAVKLAGPATFPCTNGLAGPFPCKKVDLLGYLDTNALSGGGSGSDIWGWTDPLTGKEYAITGHAEATSFVDVSDPENPLLVGILPTTFPGAVWRELKVYANHAYIVQDLVGNGMLIFDLTRLRNALPGTIFQQDTRWTGQGLSTAHTITINEQTGFAYLNGSDLCSAGPVMLDLKPNPKNPTYVGCIPQDGYTHDAQCVVYHGPDTAHVGREICVFYNEDTLTVFDVTNKAAPAMLSRTGYTTGSPQQYTHQGWFTEDQRYVLSDDELDERSGESAGNPNTTTYLWNMTDLESPQLINAYKHPTTCIDHNQYVKGNLVFQTNYGCGLRILDLSNIGAGTLTEVAYFDTQPASDQSVTSGGDFIGDWSNYAYFSSGIVVTSNITEGLFVLKPTISVPTALRVLSFTARPTTRGVAVSWRTAAETDVLGFEVWRTVAGRSAKVNRTLVPAKRAGRAGGASYRLVDATARPGTRYAYRLRVVKADGSRAWRAVAVVRAR